MTINMACRKVALEIMENDGLKTGEAINTGWCGQFSNRVAALIPGSISRSGPGHYWVEYDGKHYDAEVPDGVIDPILIPCFQRMGYNHANRPSALTETQERSNP